MSEAERIQPQLHYSAGRQGQEGVPEAFKKHRDMGEKLKQWFFFNDRNVGEEKCVSNSILPENQKR